MRYYFDIEGDNLLDGITVIHCIVLQIVGTDVVMRFSHQPGARPISEALALMAEAEELIGHNIQGFDIPAIKKLYPTWKTKARFFDTIVIARLLWPDRYDLLAKDQRNKLPGELLGNHSLKAWGYRIKEYKGAFHENADWSAWTQSMEDYCVQDVNVTRRIHLLFLAKNPTAESMELELKFNYIIGCQERHGVRLNKEKALALYVELSKARLRLEEQLRVIFPPRIEVMKTPEFYEWTDSALVRYEAPSKGGLEFILKQAGYKPAQYKGQLKPGPMKTKEHPFNPGSGDQIAARLIEKYGWKPTKFTDSGKPATGEEHLELLPYPEIPTLLEYLKVEKIIGMVSEGESAWLKLEKNGRIHGSVNTNGAVTGRCTHSKPNMSQVPGVQKDKTGVLKGLAGGYGWECRELMECDLGHNLVGADASGLELRMLAHFMARYDDGAYIKVLLEGDVHTVNMVAAGLLTRDQAKTFIYAFLYGAGDEKIGSIVGGGAREGKRLKQKFLAGLPALAKLKEAVNDAVERGYLIGLDGRHLPIRSKHAALNTLLQSAGALVMKRACVLFYEHLTITLGLTWGTDFAFVLNVHDEIQTTCRPELAEVIGKACVQAIIDAGVSFKLRCPLSGEYKIGLNWAQTH